MTWVSEAITQGEIDALKTVAAQAWADDTRYPRWKGSSFGGGQCYVTAVWLTKRLGGFVGRKQGHYVWLSPDQSYVLDLTGDHKIGAVVYEANDGYIKQDIIENDRTKTFAKRANFIFDHLDSALRVANDSLTGDAYPGEEPEKQTLIDSQYWHDEPRHDDVNDINEEYNFFYGNGSLEVAPADDFSHDQLARNLHVTDEHTGPMASGTVTVNKNIATWDVYSNINLKSLERVFKGYTDQVGWDWGGIKDVHGQVVSKTLEPVRVEKYNYVWSDGHLYMGKTAHAILASKTDTKPLCGMIEVVGSKARITPAYVETLPQLFEWASDQGFQLYASSNNLIERNETMEQKDLGVPSDKPITNPVEGDAEDDTPVGSEVEPGIHKCRICDAIFPDWHLYSKHRREEHGQMDDEPQEHGKFPDPNMDATNPDHFTEQQPLTMPVTGKAEASRVDGFDKYAKAFNYSDKDQYYVAYLAGSPVGYAVIKNNRTVHMVHSALRGRGVANSLVNKIESHYDYLETNLWHEWEHEPAKKRGWININKDKWARHIAKEPKDMLTDPIPFIYDIPANTITVGHPGQRTSDIPGKFTPAGIVEGMYEPGGTVNITTMTTMPYTVDYILTLWYYQYPELSVKRINLVDAEGKKTKLANEAAL